MATDHPTDTERELGAVMLRLLEIRDRWVLRRVESVAFSGAVEFERRVSVDFTIDSDIPTPLKDVDGEPLYYIPLGLLRKRNLVAFSVRDEAGRALPLLTHSENGPVAAAALLAAAERRVGLQMAAQDGGQVPQDVVEDIWRLATERDSEKALQIWETLGRQDQPSAVSREWRQRLNADRDFMALAYDLARDFLVVVPLTTAAGAHRVIKYSYEYTSTAALLELPRWAARLRKAWFGIVGGHLGEKAMRAGDEGRPPIKLRDWRRSFFGLSPKSLTIATPGIFHGGSYHLEVEAPEGLQITRAVLRSGPGGKELDAVRASVQRAHLYSSEAPAGCDPATAEALIDLRVRNETFVRAAAMIAAFTTILLVLLVFLWRDVTDTLSTVPTFLLIIPTGLAAYVARGREPSLTTERLFGLRLVAMSAGLWPFLAAVLLVVGRQCPDTPAQTCSSWSGITFSLIVLGALSLATLFSLLRTVTAGARPPEQVRRAPESGNSP